MSNQTETTTPENGQSDSHDLLDWFAQLRHIARARDAEYLLGTPEDHRDSFEDGETPQYEFEQLCDSASDASAHAAFCMRERI